MNCHRSKATVFQGKAAFCDGCVKLLADLEENDHSSGFAGGNKRPTRYGDEDRPRPNAPGGSYDHSQR
jgi:hypothetical protein